MPYVRIVPVAESNPLYTYNAWVNLGFVVYEEDSGLVECGSGWYLADQNRNCQITIGVYREKDLALNTGADGLANRERRFIIIDSQWDGYYLRALIAHETGHILLNTGHHVEVGRAIMAPAGAEWFARPGDYSLACSTIYVCLN